MTDRYDRKHLNDEIPYYPDHPENNIHSHWKQQRIQPQQHRRQNFEHDQIIQGRYNQILTERDQEYQRSHHPQDPFPNRRNFHTNQAKNQHQNQRMPATQPNFYQNYEPNYEEFS